MKHNLVIVCLALGAAFALSACGGRRALDDRSGVAWRRVMQAQQQARPAQRMSMLSADDAKGIMNRHFKQVGASGRGKGGGGRPSVPEMIFGGGGGGLLTPSTANLGGMDPAQAAAIASDR